MRKQRLGILMAAAASVMGLVPMAAAQTPQQLPPAPAFQGRPASLLAPAGAQIARAEDQTDVLLSCDFEVADWWRAWGSKKPPDNTSLVEGKDAHGGHGKSLRVTVPHGEHMGTTFAFRFRDRLGAEPDEIDFRYDLKFDRDWAQATSGGKLPGISGTYGRDGEADRSMATMAGPRAACS